MTTIRKNKNIYLKSTYIPNKVPTVDEIAYRELFLNVKDGKLYFKNLDDDIVYCVTNRDIDSLINNLDWSIISNTPTTLAGYGITNILDPTFNGEVLINGNLTVSGTTTTFNSTNITIEDTIFNLGGNSDLTSDDGKDRGVSFRWHNGTASKIGFFGFDRSSNKFIFIADATFTNDVVSGVKGEVDASVNWSNILNSPNNLAGYGILDAAPLSHVSDTNLHLTSAQNTLLDGITATYTEINSFQSQLNNKQPLNANLTSIIALAGTGFLKKTDTETWVLDTNIYLTSNQNITISGDIAGSGSTNITLTLPNIVTQNTYPKVTYNAKGLITSGENLGASDIPSLSWTKIISDKPTTLAGYGILDGAPLSHLDDNDRHLSSAQNSWLDSILSSDNNLSFSPVWNNASTVFTALKINVTDTASSASSNLLDLQVGGISKFSINKIGTLNLAYSPSSYYSLNVSNSGVGNLNIVGSSPYFTISMPAARSDAIPKMTSNTTPSGIASASNEAWPAWQAFNDLSSTSDYWQTGTNAPNFLAYEFISPKIITTYTVRGGYGPTYSPVNFTFEGWNGTSWIILDTQTNQDTWSSKQTYNISNTTPYIKYKINLTSPNIPIISELEMLEDSSVTDCFILKNANIGIGELNPIAKLHSTSITEQLRLGYDVNNYVANTVNSAGTLTINPIGSIPTISINETWNNVSTTFTALKINVTDTASAASSNLLDLQVGGVTKAKIDKNGAIYTYAEGTASHETQIFTGSNPGTLTHRVYSSRGTISSPSVSLSGDVLIGYASFPRLSTGFSGGPSARMKFVYKGDSVTTRATDIEFETGVGTANIWPRLGILNTGGIWIQNSDLTSSLTDRTFIHSEVANTLALRNGASAQTYRIYNTYTDASNYERLSIGWSSNVLTIATENAGSGSARDIAINPASGQVSINSTWNAAGTKFVGLKLNVINTASASNSNLAEIQVGTTETFSIRKDGWLRGRWLAGYSGGILLTTDSSGGAISFGQVYNDFGVTAGVTFAMSGLSEVCLGSAYKLTWSETTAANYAIERKTAILREDIGVLAQRATTYAQTYRIYNTYTDASNYERLSIGWSSNIVSIGPEALGTGVQRQLAFPLGTVTADTPLSITQTWNNAAITFTGIKLNITDTASAAASNLIDLQVGGTSKFSVNKSGDVQSSGHFLLGGTLPSNHVATVGYKAFWPGANSSLMASTDAGYESVWLYSNVVRGSGGWASQINTSPTWGLGMGYGTNTDLFVLARAAAGQNFGNASVAYILITPTSGITFNPPINLIEQRNSTNAQTYRIYNTYTDASNYERASLNWSTNLFSIATENAGSGSARDLEFNVGGSKLHISTNGSIYLDVAGQTVGNARGSSSIDLQTIRNTATRIASGSQSVAIGVHNTSSGAYAATFGTYNIASGQSAIAIGTGCTASAYRSVAIGDTCNAAIGDSISMGYLSLTNDAYQFAYGGYATVEGTNQVVIILLYVNTSSAASAVLAVGAYALATRGPLIPAKRSCTVTGLITAYSDATDGYKTASWEIKCLIERNASNVTRIVGTPIIEQLFADADAIAGGWDVLSIAADDTNEALSITVVGENGTNIRWQGSLFYGQVGY